MRRILLLAVVFALTGSATAHACSCVPASGDPEAEIAESDAAVFGKVVKRTEKGRPPAGDIVYKLRVLQDYKGNLGRFVRVRTASSSAACGFTIARGGRIALLLYRQNDRYSGSLCGVRSKKYFEGDAKAGSSACAAQALA